MDQHESQADNVSSDQSNEEAHKKTDIQPLMPSAITSVPSPTEGEQTPTGSEFRAPAATCEDEADLPPPVTKNSTSLPPAAVDQNVAIHASATFGDEFGSVYSHSQASDRQFGQASASDVTDLGDRVFPIRSLVSVDQSFSTSSSAGKHEYFPRFDYVTGDHHQSSNAGTGTEGSRRAETAPLARGDSGTGRGKHKSTLPESIFSPNNESPPVPPFREGPSDGESIHANDGVSPCSERDGFVSRGSSTPGDLVEGLYGTRLRHITMDEGHYVITGRDGTLERGEDEPIQAPGAVQSFGVLIAIREESDGHFTVRLASENSARILGHTPQQLFKLGSFLDIFSGEQADNVLDHIDFIRDEDSDIAMNGPEVFSLSIRQPRRRNVKLWCAMHINSSNPDYVICEFELDDDDDHPLRPSDEMNPSMPEDTPYQQPSLEEYNESTENSSKLLRVFRSARKTRGEVGAMQVFDIMSQVQQQLGAAPNVEKLLQILVGIVKELTGFHKVMIYQFDPSYNGKVVTELVDPTQPRDLYNGLHFPASDIPRQARELYKINKVRLLYDRDLESARLVYRTHEDLEKPLNLTHSYLRAISPIHSKYLANLAVRASMSISINAFSELWGLIACHSYGPRGMRVAFPIRKMCRLIGDTASRNIERLSYTSRLQARKLINTVPTDKNPSGYIIASSEDLLELFDADFGILSLRGETKILGKLDKSQEALAMLEYLRVKKFTSVVSTHDIMMDFPDLKYPPGFAVIAGVLYIPLSVVGQEFICFLRKGQVKEVKWAGNPYEKVLKDGISNYLEPRTSFQVWHETIHNKCRDWSEEQIETAAVLCLVYGKFTEVWQQNELALQNGRLTGLLLANYAHEVRTPLNAIINYLEIALEGSLDQNTRDNLVKSHLASKSLVYVANDLLDLTKTEEGYELFKDDVIDLPACLREATYPFEADAKRKGVSYSVVEHPGLPQLVCGNYKRVRQAIANLTANAIEHTTPGSVQVECYVIEVMESKVKIEIVVQDTGCGMGSAKLAAMFRELEQVSTDEDLDDIIEKPSGNRALGFGLAVVARTVRNMNGQLCLKSEEGVGSRFVIQLPFDLPTNERVETLSVDDNNMAHPGGAVSVASITKLLPPTKDGEVTLVDHCSWPQDSTTGSHTIRQRRSFDDAESNRSLQSCTSLRSANTRISGTSMANGMSRRSHADRLIDTLSTPLPYGDGYSKGMISRRFASKEAGHAYHDASNSIKSLSDETASGLRQDRPGPPARSITSPPGFSMEARAPKTGVAHVQDSRIPIRPVRISDDELLGSPASGPQSKGTSGVMFEIPTQLAKKPIKEPALEQAQEQTPVNAVSGYSGKLRVLIAEDDPINLKILRRRLEKVGHEVVHTVNGYDCALVYSERCRDFDVILMDMQMPIVDGLGSIKMIRAFEKSEKCSKFSHLAQHQGHIPIFAISASLLERDRPKYIEAGFDGWILKPVDFKQLHVLLQGISDDMTRNDCLYAPGEWERGGWFSTRSILKDSTPTGPSVHNGDHSES